MGTSVGKLTALQVTRLAKGTEPAFIGDGGGLYLQVTPRGASWIFRYRLDRKRVRDMGLGPVHTIGLAKARELARQCREQRLGGLDPIEVRRKERQRSQLDAAKAMTFRQCAEAYIAAHQAGWRNARHAQQWPQTMRDYVYDVFGDLPVQAIDVGLVLKVIEPLWQTKTETANRVRGRIESVLDWAKTRGYREDPNPAAWRGHLDHVLPKRSKVQRVEHHAAVPYDQVAGVVAALRAQDTNAALAVEFLIHTSARLGEVLNGAKWSAIDEAARVWTVPAEQMKSGKEHRVPLSDRAMEIIERMRAIRVNDHVFPSTKPGSTLSEWPLTRALRLATAAPATLHGFRSTFRDWAAERTNFPSEVAEMALAHAVGDKVEAAYRRGDLFEKRRQLAEAWSRFCSAPPTPATGKVVAISGARGSA